MNKEFVPYELAVKLKEIGFDEPCLDKYDPRFEKLSSNMETWSNEYYPENLMTPAPLYQQAFRWFRENHDLNYVIVKAESWFYTINGCNTQEGFNTYEEAELACLNKLIEIVQGGKK